MIGIVRVSGTGGAKRTKPPSDRQHEIRCVALRGLRWLVGILAKNGLSNTKGPIVT